ncbi:hypothetical protein HMPREF9154_0093 [Arachnia propionica F0230a]|nr:hypothetical protein HMPREF9154_0093 [Arachnia propionica F0230a]
MEQARYLQIGLRDHCVPRVYSLVSALGTWCWWIPQSTD